MGSVKRTELTAEHHRLCRPWRDSQKHSCPFHWHRSWCTCLEAQDPHQHLLAGVRCTSTWLCIHTEGRRQLERLTCSCFSRSCAHLRELQTGKKHHTDRSHMNACVSECAAYMQVLSCSRVGHTTDSCKRNHKPSGVSDIPEQGDRFVMRTGGIAHTATDLTLSRATRVNAPWLTAVHAMAQTSLSGGTPQAAKKRRVCLLLSRHTRSWVSSGCPRSAHTGQPPA